MKTAISLRDERFRPTGAYVERMRKTRCKLYAEALARYLARRASDRPTAASNREGAPFDGTSATLRGLHANRTPSRRNL